MKNQLESRKHSSFTEATNYHSLVEFVANRNRQSRCHAILLAGRNHVFSVATGVSNAVFYAARLVTWARGVARQRRKYREVARTNASLNDVFGGGRGR